MALSSHGEIVNAVATAIATVSGLTAANVKTMKVPRAFEQDTFPLICVCYGDDDLTDAYQTFEGTLLVNYEVLIVIITKKAQERTANPDTVPKLRQDIRKKVYKPDIYTTVRNAEINLNPTFDASYIDGNYDVSAFSVTYTNEEELP